MKINQSLCEVDMVNRKCFDCGEETYASTRATLSCEYVENGETKLRKSSHYFCTACLCTGRRMIEKNGNKYYRIDKYYMGDEE